VNKTKKKLGQPEWQHTQEETDQKRSPETEAARAIFQVEEIMDQQNQYTPEIEAAVKDAMERHPGLTREEALELLTA